jgi:Sec-independent protein translocase protein TatA
MYSIHHLVVVVVVVVLLLGVLLTGQERNAMVGVIRF